MTSNKGLSDLVAAAVEKKILETIETEAPLTIRAIVERSGFSQPTVRKYLQRLSERGAVSVRQLEGGTSLYSPVKRGAVQ